MADFYTYAYVEDEPSQAILTKIIDYVNSQCPNRFDLHTGVPIIKHGFGNLQKKTQSFLPAATKGEGIRSIFLTDWIGLYGQSALHIFGLFIME